MFLQSPADNEATSRLYQSDVESRGFVMNLSRAWAWRPDVWDAFAALRGLLTSKSSLRPRELPVLACATASSRGDSYCSLAWGKMLAKASDGPIAAAVLQGSENASLTERERALSVWARKVVENPNATTPQDVEALRAVGLSEQEIFEATTFIAFRLAFSTVNDALGIAPDWQLAEGVPEEVRKSIDYGRESAQRAG
jgi:uncharacterized peroxidase-related enzyme